MQSRVTWGQGDNLVHLLAQPSLQQFAMEPLMGPGGPPSPVMPSPQLSVDRIWLPGVAPDGSSVPHVHKLDRVVLPDGCFFIGSKLVKALADSGYGIRMRNLEKSLRPDGTPGCREPSKELCNEMMRAGIQIHRGRRLPQLVAANALRPVLLQRLVHNDVVDLLEGCSVAGPPETAAEPLDGDQVGALPPHSFVRSFFVCLFVFLFFPFFPGSHLYLEKPSSFPLPRVDVVFTTFFLLFFFPFLRQPQIP